MSDPVTDRDDSRDHENDYAAASMPTQLGFRAPARELARALSAIATVADAKDSSGAFAAVRVEVTDSGVIAVTAANPLMVASVLIPDAEAMADGAVEISPGVARELAKVAASKVVFGSDVDAVVRERIDCVEMELIYGLAICQHVTRRPTLGDTVEPAHEPGQIFRSVAREVGVSIEKPDRRPVLNPSDPAVSAVPQPPSMTPSQIKIIGAAAKALGDVVELHHTDEDGRFLARIGGDFAALLTCRADEDDDELDEDADDETLPGPIVDGTVGDIEDDDADVDDGDGDGGTVEHLKARLDELADRSADQMLRIVNASPVGGVS